MFHPQLLLPVASQHRHRHTVVTPVLIHGFIIIGQERHSSLPPHTVSQGCKHLARHAPRRAPGFRHVEPQQPSPPPPSSDSAKIISPSPRSRSAVVIVLPTGDPR
ncbi:hypothetical protein E2C01_052428 [Portunus trituberculatus]|uniref:Uncharacterized protein n=1 Tax=Portunus trituberculatus TaxID=210409 RepID=A0A5B7GLS9_PORTR|nr:hypothetical protein [Portunus trituberculatus]